MTGFIEDGREMFYTGSTSQKTAKSLVNRSMEEANEHVKRGTVLKGRSESLEDVPEMYTMSKKIGLDGVEDSDEQELFDVRGDDEP